MPDAPRRIRDSSLALFQVGLLSFVFRLVTSALIARAMGPTMMGIWILLTLLPSYAEGFGRLKADIAAVYYLGQRRYGLGEMCFTLNLIAVVLSSAICLVFAVGEPWIVQALFGGTAVSRALYYSVLATIPLHFVSMNYAYLLIHLEDVPAYNAQNLLKQVVPGVVAVILIYTWQAALPALVAGLLLGNAGALAVSAWRVHRVEALQPTWHPAMLRDLAGFGGRLYLAGLVEHLNTYLTGLIVGIYMPAAQVAFFRMGQDRLQVIDQVPSALNTMLYPRMSKSGGAGEPEQLTARSFRVLLILLTATGVAAAIAVWPLVLLLYGRPFLPMTAAVWLLLPGVIAAGATSPVVQYFMGTGRPHYVWRMALVPLAAQVVAGIPLTLRFGYRGAAAAMSAAFVLHAVVRLAIFTRRSRRAPVRLAPGGEDMRLVVAFAIERIRGVARLRAAAAQA